MAKDGRHIQARIISNQPDRPKEDSAVRVWDKLTGSGYSPRQIVTDALIALGAQEQRPKRLSQPAQVDSDAIAQQVALVVRQSMMEEMRTLADAVLNLSERLKNMKAGVAIGGYDSDTDTDADMGMGMDDDFDDNDFDFDYARSIAEAVMQRNEG